MGANNRFLFIGLGNPGEPYARTRHNAGWLALDMLLDLWHDDSIPPTWQHQKKVEAEVCKIHHDSHDIFLLKPQTYMNDSGRSAAAAIRWFLETDPTENPGTQLKNVVVFHDDLDLELGKYKLQFDSGPKIHNGLNSVRDHLKTTAFWTARIGVDSRGGDRTMPGKAYVLQRLTDPEFQQLRAAVKILAQELPYSVLG